MSAKPSGPRALQTDPLSVDDILATGFYRPERDLPRESEHEGERLEELVRELKRQGYSKANKSLVIRAALAQLDVEKVPRFH